jgi:hypothetical protein
MNVFRRMRRAAVPALVGWLFADLLLALAMIFLVANASGQIVSIPPTPTATVPPPTPTIPPPPCLEKSSYFIDVTVHDLNGLLSDTSSAQTDIENQLRSPVFASGSPTISDLSNRQAGLTLIYVGAPAVGGNGTNDQVFEHIKTVLQLLGQQGYLFTRTAYHGELLLLGSQYTTVQIEIYLFGKYTVQGTCVAPTAGQ